MSLLVNINQPLDRFELNIKFDLSARGLTALFGPSGAGKSVTINAIAGLIKPVDGHISLYGEPFFDRKANRFKPAHLRRIGYVFQDSRLFPHMSVKKNLLFGAKRANAQPSESYVQHVIDLLDIGQLLHRYPSRLSGGEKQRIAIGRAILSDPLLMLLDEPLAALDAGRREEILKLIETVRDESKIPILFVSHSISEVIRLADQMILMDKGQITAKGNVQDIISRLDLANITGNVEAGSCFAAPILRHDTDYDMSEISMGKSSLWVPKINEAPGSTVRLRILARDIMLSKQLPQEISANNMLPVTIKDWRMDGKLHVDIQLQAETATLLARITQKSFNRLKLTKNEKLFAIVKSVSMERRVETL